MYHHLTYYTILCAFWGLLVWRMARIDGPDRDGIDATPLLIILALIAARWPTLLLNEQINPDESQRIALALLFQHDAVPWRGADPTTGGPLNSYILLIPAAFGLTLDYVTARAVGLILIMVSAVCWYLTVSGLRDRFVACSAVFPAVTFLCFSQHHNYTHYSTEILPMTVLSIAALAVGGLNRGAEWRLFFVGLLLGAVPFTKLQASPLAVAGFLIILLCAWRVRGLPFLRSAATMTLGGLIVPAMFGMTLAATGSLEDAWNSYILNSLSVSTVQLGPLDFVYWVVGYPPWKNPTSFGLYIVLLGLILLAGTGKDHLRRLAAGPRFWATGGGLAFAAMSVYVVWKPGILFFHYLYLALPAMVVVPALTIAPEGSDTPWDRFWRAVRHRVAGRGMQSAAAFVLIAAAAGALVSAVRPPPEEFERIATQKPDPVVAIIRALAKDDAHFAVWGYMPQYYAITGIRPTTRDAMAQWQVRESALKEYYRARYLRDFEKSRPNVIVDATGPGNFQFKDYRPVPIETFKRLYGIVRTDYVLVATVAQCATPHTRFFVSRRRLAELGVEPESLPIGPACLRNGKDLAELLARFR